MRPNIKPKEPLSQVVFVEDYLQLVFQDEGFSIYNLSKIEIEEHSMSQGSAGFCDALVSLIGQRITNVTSTNENVLSLSFEKAARLLVLSGEIGARGPEAFQFNGPNNFLVVEQNS